ncbi:MAG: Secretory protein [Candidatus Daviesbacteria bacterium GW2011_GWA1_41_61]|nr:MAG: Secretory protein [Candidatus Daviesbacteria bacterium GW2011_GWA1_41_61]
MPKTSKTKGFTLIELLVVVAIIAILAVVSLALFGNVQKAARDGVRRSNIDTLAKNLETRFDYGSSLYQQLDPNEI